MADIGEIRARLSLDTSDFNRRLASARTEMERTSTSAQGTGRSITGLRTVSQTTGDAFSRNLSTNLTRTSGNLSRTGELALLVGQSLDAVRNSSNSVGETVAGSLNPQLLTVEELLAQLQSTSETTGQTLSTNLNPEINTAQENLNNASASAISFEETLTRIQLASLALGAALSVGVGASVTLAADFEQQMKSIQAVSGATQDEVEALANLAKELGASSSFSASEAAAGIEELIKAGLTVEQVLGGGLSGALDLAAAGGLELADAAAIASTALNSFKKDNLSVAQAADILAGAANASATDVGELKYGLSSVAAVAAGAGMSFKDTSTALAVFAQNGLAGSDAGTSLKTMLMNLSPSTKEATTLFKKLGIIAKDGSNQFYDAKGNLKSLSDVTDVLRKSLVKLNPKERGEALKTMFGSDAVRAGIILFNEGAKGVENMWSAMSKVTAADVAKTKLDTLNGAVDGFRGTLETVGIEIGEEFLPAITDIVKFAADLTRKFGEVDGSTIKVGLAMVGTAAGVALVASTIGKLSLALRAFALTPVGAAITALSILGGIVAGVVTHQNEMKEVSLDNANAMLEQADSLGVSIKKFDELKTASKLSTEQFGRFLDINSELKKTSDPNVIARLKDEQEKLRQKSGLSNEQLSEMVRLNGEIIKTVPESTLKITSQGNAILENTNKAKAYNKEMYEKIRLELDAQKAKAEANMSDLLAKEEEAQKRINGLMEKKKSLGTEEINQRQKIKDLNHDLANAKANNDSLEIDRINTTIEREKHKLGAIGKQKAEVAATIVKRTEEIGKIQEQIGKLDEVKRKMVDLEMRQGGINAKRGEEIKTIDTAISKLQKQKAELEKAVPVNKRNTDEYREAAGAIQDQINKLQGTRNKVVEIIGKAAAMNDALGKDVSKNVRVNYTENREPRKFGPQQSYHTGGLVGRGQMPMLHTGGLASQFANAPSHNEVDVRLLRNEMVLTEAQQSNLMRLIDAGITKGGATSSDNGANELARVVDAISSRPINVGISVDGREFAKATAKYNQEELDLLNARKNRMGGAN